MKRVKVFLVLVAVLCLCLQASSKTIRVPADSSTIQKGINGAKAGDTVLVAMGIYSTSTNGEIFPINMKSGVVLLSKEGKEYTTLQANYDSTVIRCINVNSNTVIKGFKISKGESIEGGGIYCENASLKIIQNEISINEATYGAGIYCFGGSPQISENLIINNSKADKGCGIYSENSSVKIMSNEISGNNGGGIASYGGGIFCQGGSPQIIENTISKNKITVGSYLLGSGAGIYCVNVSCQIIFNTITANELFIYGYGPNGYGAGIYCENSSGKIENNLIEGNYIWGGYYACIWAGGYGAGVSCSQCTSFVISKNTIDSNTFSMPASTGYGGGIYCQGCYKPTILENIIKNNGHLPTPGGQSVGGGGIYFTLCSKPIVKKNLIVSNTAYSGGGIYFKDSFADSINNNTIDLNSGDGVISDNCSLLKVFNNIISNCSAGKGIANVNNSTLKVFHNDVWHNSDGNFSGCANGTGDTSWGVNRNGTPCDSFYNIIRDPLFVISPDSLYYLQAGSPCINAGDPKSPKDPDGTIADLGVSYYPTAVPDDNEVADIPHLELYQNYPNPFNPVTKIEYCLNKDCLVNLTVYNILGQKIIILINEYQPAGHKRVQWDGKDEKGQKVASGLYLYRIKAGDFTQNKKMILLK